MSRRSHATFPCCPRAWRSSSARVPRPRPGRAAFTMAEVLFAIIILGMGLILLAAAFPVGIVQTEKTQDMTTAGIVARMAYDQIKQVPADNARPTYGDGWCGWVD